MSDSVLLRPVIEPIELAHLLKSLPDAEFLAGGSAFSPDDVMVTGVSVDSADIEPGWIFVGVPGSRHGARFSAAAVEAGASALVTDPEGVKIIGDVGVPIVSVSNPREAGAGLAAALYGPGHEDVLKVGITGTNGKTTTTYFTRAALGSPGRRIAVFGTLEIDTGKSTFKSAHTTHEAPVVQRALTLAAQDGAEVAVIEVSSHALELGRVDGIHFNLGMFTNLQHDHLDFHKTMDAYLAAKAKLFEPGRTDVGVVAVDDQYGRRLARSAQIPIQAVQVLTDDNPDLGQIPLWTVTSIEGDPSSGGSRFHLVTPEGQTFDALCPLPGGANVQDAALSLVGAWILGVPLDIAIDNLKSAPPVDGRSHWVQRPGSDSPAVMVDFGHTPEAIELLLDTVRPVTAGRLIAVFGTEGDRDASKRAPLARAFAEGADVLFVTCLLYTSPSPRD